MCVLGLVLVLLGRLSQMLVVGVDDESDEGKSDKAAIVFRAFRPNAQYLAFTSRCL